MASPVIETSSENSGGNVFTKPTGLANGDVLYLLYWAFHSSSGAGTAPTGFTEVAEIDGADGFGSFATAAVYRKIITNAAGEPADYTVTRGGGSNLADGGEIFRVSGADGTTPEGDSGTNSATSTSATTGANITTSTDSLILGVWNTPGQDPSTPSGMTSQFFHDTDVRGFTEAVTGSLSGATRSSTVGSCSWYVAWVAVVPTVAGANRRRYTLTTHGVG